jgi:hypothetical protein
VVPAQDDVMDLWLHFRDHVCLQLEDFPSRKRAVGDLLLQRLEVDGKRLEGLLRSRSDCGSGGAGLQEFLGRKATGLDRRQGGKGSGAPAPE